MTDDPPSPEPAPSPDASGPGDAAEAPDGRAGERPDAPNADAPVGSHEAHAGAAEEPSPSSGEPSPGAEDDGSSVASRTRRSRLPTIVTILLLLLAAVGAWLQGRHLFLIYSFDGPWHLACGRLIVESGFVPRSDPFCFPNDGVDWVNLNWLAQAAVYRLYRFAGPPGAVIATLASVLTLILGTLVHLRRRGLSAPIALIALVLATWPSISTMSLRPRSWSFAFIAILLALLYNSGPPGRSLGALRGLLVLALMSLWNQVHGGFAYGYAILGLDLLGSALDHRRDEGRLVNRRSLELGVLIVASLGSLVALHPHGLAALEHALRYQERIASFRGVILELMPPNFSTLHARPMQLCLLALIGMLAFGRRLDFRSVLLLLVFGHFQLQYERFTYLSPLVFVPIVAAELDHMLRDAATTRPRLADLLERTNALFEQAWQKLPLVLVPAFLTAMLVSPMMPPRNRFHTGHTNRPAGVLEAITALPRDSRIFNHWNLGGLLDWTLGPTGRVFIDGRGDLHDRGPCFRDYMAITRLEKGWRQKLEDYKIDYVAFKTSSDLGRTLVYVEKWEIVYVDPHYCILKKPANWTPTSFLEAAGGPAVNLGKPPGDGPVASPSSTGTRKGGVKEGGVKEGGVKRDKGRKDGKGRADEDEGANKDDKPAPKPGAASGSSDPKADPAEPGRDADE